MREETQLRVAGIRLVRSIYDGHDVIGHYRSLFCVSVRVLGGMAVYKTRFAERRENAARGAVFFVSLLFGLGLMFGYYIVSPLAINFLANYQITPEIKNQFDITSYIGVLVTLSLGCALIFQMPMIAFVLSKVGVLTPKFMKSYRKHAWVVILIVAGIITPSPDIYSQVLVAIPLGLLYEVSIVVSGRIERSA